MYKVGIKYEVSGNSKDPKKCKEPECQTNVKRTINEGIRPGRSHMNEDFPDHNKEDGLCLDNMKRPSVQETRFLF